MPAPDILRHAEAAEALRAAAAPIGSTWQHVEGGPIWRVVMRSGGAVLLQQGRSVLHRRGPLATLLWRYNRVA